MLYQKYSHCSCYQKNVNMLVFLLKDISIATANISLPHIYCRRTYICKYQSCKYDLEIFCLIHRIIGTNDALVHWPVKTLNLWRLRLQLTRCLFAQRSYCTFDTEHYNDVIMTTIASQITSLTIVYSTVYSDADQSKHQSSASLAFVWGIHRGPVNSPHKWPVTRKMFPFDDVIMRCNILMTTHTHYFISNVTKMTSTHYSFVTWGLCRLNSSVTRLFIQQLIQTKGNENIRAPHD